MWLRHRFEGHENWINRLLFVSRGLLVSGGEDAAIRLWDLDRGTLLRVLPQDESITCLTVAGPDLILFGDSMGKLSYLDLDTRETIHLLPNILTGTGRHGRSSKYHDKATDCLHVTDNGYLVTASTGSRFIKIWRIKRAKDSTDHCGTDVTELQILREHAEPLTWMTVRDEAVISVSGGPNGGKMWIHTFPRDQPRYEMAINNEEEDSLAASGVLVGGSLATTDEGECAEVCRGPRLCRVGKTGLVRSSSSFQVRSLALHLICT